MVGTIAKDLVYISRFFKKYSGFWNIALMLACTLAATFLELLGFAVIVPILEISLDGQTESKAKEIVIQIMNFLSIEVSLLNLLMLMVALFVGKAFLILMVNLFKAKSILTLRLKIQYKIARDVIAIDYEDMKRLTAGFWINILNRETERVTGVYSSYITLITDLVSSITLFAILMSLEPLVILIAVSSCLPVVVLLLFFTKISKKLSFQYSQYYENSCKFMIEYIHQNQYLRIVNNGDSVVQKVCENVQKFAHVEWYLKIITSLSQSIREPLAIVVLAFIVFFLSSNGADLSQLAVLSIILYRLVNYALGLLQVLQKLISEFAGVYNVNELFNSYTIKKEKTPYNIKTLLLNEESIFIKDLNFSFNKKTILKNINMHIKPCALTGIIGRSGAGKSTLFFLLTGLLKPSSGKIFVGDNDIHTLSKENFNNQIGYVGQEVAIFDDTIENNITLWDKDIDKDQKAYDALLKADLLEFCDRLQDVVGEKGVNISGGQRQRLAIARELYRNPKLLILDEATAALDHETENNIMQTIKNLQDSITIIMITHNMNLIDYCDKIYQFKAGRVVNDTT